MLGEIGQVNEKWGVLVHDGTINWNNARGEVLDVFMQSMFEVCQKCCRFVG